MFNHLAFISGDWVTDLIISITAGVFLFFAWRELLSIGKVKKQLKKLAEIKELGENGYITSDSLSDAQLLWVTDHLVYTPRDGGLEVETKGELWLSKTPISHMLPAYDSSRYKLVPALLTSIGITGTFLGITLGLSQFSMAGDSKALLASAADLLEGMKTAFYTSLAGLSTSAVFMALMKVTSSSLSKAQARFTQAISRQYFEASAVFYLKGMSNEGQEHVIDAQLRSATAMEEMGAKMDATASTLGQLGQSFNGDMIADKVSTALSTSIEATMAPMLESIKHELASLKDIKEQSQKELVELLIGEMKTQLIEPVTEELNKTSVAVTASNDISTQLNSNVERVVTSTSETVNTINEFQKETMIKLQSFAESLKTILGSFKEDTQGAMSQIASEVSNMLGDASSGMDKQRIAFEDSSQRAASAFEGMKDSLESALDERQSAEKALFENVTSRVNGLLGEIATSFENQMSVISATGEAASTLMTQAQSDFETSVQMRRAEESKMFEEVEQRIGGLVNNAAKGMEEQQATFELSAQRAASAFEGMKNSIDAALDERQVAEKAMFENVTNRVSGLLSEVATSFEQQTSVLSQTGEAASTLMNKAQKDFEESVQLRRDEESHLFGEMETRIGSLVQNVQAIFKEQADAIKLVGDEASGVMQSAKTELQQGLGDIDTKVKSMSETVQRELEAFRLQYQENLSSYFEQQNNILEDSLSKQRNGLNEVVDNFRQVFESEYKARHNLLQELTAQYEKLEASAGTLERVAKAIGLNDAAKMAELQDAAHTMGREIASLKKEYAQASATFVDVTENLPKAMDDYFTRANESFETFFKDFDQSASAIHNKLSQAAGYLINSQVQRREFEADEVNA